MDPIAVLPSPSEPTFIAVGAVIGGFVGDSITRALRYDADNSMQMTMSGTYYGTALALAAYLATNVLAGFR